MSPEQTDEIHGTSGVQSEMAAQNPTLHLSRTPTASQSAHKPNNPFAQGNYAPPSDPQVSYPLESYEQSQIDEATLVLLPFKTSNRIIADLKSTPALLRFNQTTGSNRRYSSLLASRPVEYCRDVAETFYSQSLDLYILNNALDYAPSTFRIEHPDKGVVVHGVRGILGREEGSGLFHFKWLILRPLSNFQVDKHELHVVPQSLVSSDDIALLGGDITACDNLLEDVFFKSLSCSKNFLIRVSLFSAEFSKEDLFSISDQQKIRERYLTEDDLEESDELVPSPAHCFHTLLKALKGPLTLPPDEPVHTINIARTSLNLKLDLELLLNKLSFQLGENGEILVPPSLSSAPALKESFIRKVVELIFLGKNLEGKTINDFGVVYSFSDNASQIYNLLNELDRHSAIHMARNDGTDSLYFFTALSASSFYQDELVIRCFENSVKSDLANRRFYVDCFQSIMSHRSAGRAGRLRSYYNNQYLKGQMYGEEDFRSALRVLGINDIPENIDPDLVINIYKSACVADPKNFAYFNSNLRVIASVCGSAELTAFIKNELVPSQIALQELHIEEVTEDEVVVTAFEFRLDEVLQSSNFNANSLEVQFLQRCLLSIAVQRKSFILMNYIETKFPNLLADVPKALYPEALESFHLDGLASDFDLISKFQELLFAQDSESDVRILRARLLTIAAEKKSEVLKGYLKRGNIDPSLLPPQDWPTGLDNIGNTCYLNSLLQYYFSIKPVRETILSFRETEVESLRKQERKIGGRFVEGSELERSFQFIYRLQDLFHEMITSRKRCVQPSKELVYLSFLPLASSVDFKTESTRAIQSEPIIIDSQSPEPLNKFVDLSGGDNGSGIVDTADDDLIEIDDPKVPLNDNNELVNIESSEESKSTRIMAISLDQIESAIEIGRQQDVTECIENVTFQIETALEPELLDDEGEQLDMVKKLFSGRTKQTLTPLDGKGQQRISFERFFSLIINVSDHPRDIYDALDNYFSEDVVKLEDGDVKKSLTIFDLPEVLQFHVQRVLFDRERLMAYKSLEPIPFDEEIFLDRYLETDDISIRTKREEVFEWKTRIKALKQEKEHLLLVDPQTRLSPLHALEATRKYLLTKLADSDEFEVSTVLIEAIEAQEQKLKKRLEAIESESEQLQDSVSNHFNSHQNVRYKLFAIFIHRGEALYGHYWVYIKDPVKNIYRKYNDDTVTEAPISEVLNFATNNTATPYYMAYVREPLEKEYVQPLKREFA